VLLSIGHRATFRVGLDWAYGFDKVNGMTSGSQFHFTLGQEF
jgi:outer membrane protein insertion porin family